MPLWRWICKAVRKFYCQNQNNSEISGIHKDLNSKPLQGGWGVGYGMPPGNAVSASAAVMKKSLRTFAYHRVYP